MRDFLRFFLSPADQQRVVPESITVRDVPYSASPAVGQPYPQSLQVTFRIGDPDKGAPALLPLFPGALTFFAAEDAAKQLPTPAQVERASYGQWRTRGTLLVKAEPSLIGKARQKGELPRMTDELLAASPGAPPMLAPNRVWYSPVQLPEPFLFDTLVALKRNARLLDDRGRVVAAGDPTLRHAVAGFLGGKHELRLIADLRKPAEQDDVVTHPMPTVVMDPVTGEVSLTLTAAIAQDPRDASRKVLDELHPQVAELEPVHPFNGIIPARQVFRFFQPRMLGAGDTDVLAQKVVATTPETPRFTALRFTRIWLPRDECSAHFPWQTVKVVRDTPAGEPVLEQRLPTHGLLWVAMTPELEAAPQVRVSVVSAQSRPASEMRWLDGMEKTDHRWRVMGDTVPLSFDLSRPRMPHILMRRRMRDEMLAEIVHKWEKGSWACTYMSLRRSVRALVDNRIMGGRLNFGCASTSPDTVDLLQVAWAHAPRLPGSNPPQALPGFIVHDQPALPNPRSEIYPEVDKESLKLRAILHAFFPEAAEDSGSGTTSRTEVFSRGKAAYFVWQIIYESFQQNVHGVRRNFHDDWLVGGGAGALVAMGLAEGDKLHLDPTPTPEELGMGEQEGMRALEMRVARTLRRGLKPGAILQFWFSSVEELHQLKSRTLGQKPGGHSVVFKEYMGPPEKPTGFRTYEPKGESSYEFYERGNESSADYVLSVGVWSASNWKE